MVTGIVDGLPGVILKVANLPPVSAAVRIATPTAEAINDRYQAAHDAVVSTELYLRCPFSLKPPPKPSPNPSP